MCARCLLFSSLQFSLVTEVKQNLSELVEEWKSLQQEFLSPSPSSPSPSSSISPENQLVPSPNELPLEEMMHGEGAGDEKSLSQQILLVRRSDLEKLSTEAMMLKEFLPKVLNHEYMAMIGKLSHVEQGKFASKKHRFVLYVHASPHPTVHKENHLVYCLVHSDDLHKRKRSKITRPSLVSGGAWGQDCDLCL